jgi:predicted SAM-dependent methyltransferase
MHVLHFAPEPGLRTRLRSTPIRYVTADLRAEDAEVHVDLADVTSVAAQLGPGQFDLVLNSHMLEHIPDDRSAMRALAMLLAPAGEALIQVPVDPARASTYEDWSIDSGAERLRAFGQEDHVRIYGRDVTDRLTEAGFTVRQLLPDDTLAGRFKLDRRDPIFVCTRAPA